MYYTFLYKYAKLFNSEENGGIAKWDETDENWYIPNINLAANNTISRRLVSEPGLSRPESEYSRRRRQIDKDVRWKNKDVLQLDLQMPEQSTQEYKGPDTVSKVNYILDMDLDEFVRQSPKTREKSEACDHSPYLQLHNVSYRVLSFNFF